MVVKLTGLIRQAGGLAPFLRKSMAAFVSLGPLSAFRRFLKLMGVSRHESVNLQAAAMFPSIAIVIPVTMARLGGVASTLCSIRQLSTRNVEVILAASSCDTALLDTIKALQAKHSLGLESHLCISEADTLPALLNKSLSLVSCSHFFVLYPRDRLEKNALYWLGKILHEQPDIDFVYSDEALISNVCGESSEFLFKPDWSPEFLLGTHYTGNLSAFRTELVYRLGGYREVFSEACAYDLALRVGGAVASQRIAHLAKVLYQGYPPSNEQTTAIHLLAKDVVADFLASRKENFIVANAGKPGCARVAFIPKGAPKVSIIIPTANGTIEFNQCIEWHIDALIDSLLEKTTYDNYEIIVVHNGNLRPDQIKRFAAMPQLRLVLYCASVFNLSEKINLGCSQASGEYLVIMNDDIRIKTHGWLEPMLGMVQREGIAAVGPKLLFPDGTIQHAGVILLDGLPGHPYYGQLPEIDGYGMGVRVSRNYLAVTGACAITPRSLFDELGGYSQHYPLNYNDVDYCLKAYARGFRSVYLADVEMLHFEGVSKSGGRSAGLQERRAFIADWSRVFPHDPFYNPNLNQLFPYLAECFNA